MLDEFNRLPKHLRKEINKHLDKTADESEERPCLWLATDGRCVHYDHRPGVCRDFRPGSRACLAHRFYNGKADVLEAESTSRWLHEWERSRGGPDPDED